VKLSDIPSNLDAATRAELLSCDPGKELSAVAYWLRGQLVHVGFTKGFVFPGPELAIEVPQIYPKGVGETKADRIDPNDLIDVAYSAGVIAGMRQASRGKTYGTKIYRPREWKKQVPKHINHHRIMQRLTLEEIACLPPETVERIAVAINGGPYSWQGHNLLDAVGIGLVYLKRIRP